MNDTISLSFHGAAQTVTGSRHILRVGNHRILVDAGLFQGLKALRKLNWHHPGFDPTRIDDVLLTHTHIDHVGYLPRLVKKGLDADVHCTEAAYVLSELMLEDSARIQEEDAYWANKKGFSKHKPALPLYTMEDAEAALALRRQVRWKEWFNLGSEDRIRVRYWNSGHLLGAAFIEVKVKHDKGELTIVFSGDVGRFEVPLHLNPDPLPACDILVLESTYGDREHDLTPVGEQVGPDIRRCLHGGGTVLIPAFAVGRTQQVAFVLRRLMKAGEIPEVPIHVDSPMATSATSIYSRFLRPGEVDDDVFEDGRLRIFPGTVQFHRSVEESKRLNRMRGPRVIISSSGMLSAGRVLHHLAQRAPHPENLVLVAGYQAPGTRGRRLVNGERTIRVHGRDVPVRCRVASIHGLSGHADRSELLQWVRTAPQAPRHIFPGTRGRETPKSAGWSSREKDRLCCFYS